MYMHQLIVLATALLRVWAAATDDAAIADASNSSSSEISSPTAAAASATATADTGTPLRTAMAEKLVRYRRHPFSIIKHISRASHRRHKPRRRVKRPKVTYAAAPSYSYGPPVTYYKPRKRPKLTMDDIQHLSYDVAEYELPHPHSSYESQVMDLDFYTHDADADGDGDESTSSDSKYHSYEEVEEQPAYSAAYEEAPPAIKHGHGHDDGAPRAPHQRYGVPTKHEYASDFRDGGYGSAPSPPAKEHGYSSYSSSSSTYETGSYDAKRDYEHRPDAPLPQTPPTAYGVSASDHDTYAPPPPAPPPPQRPSHNYAVYEKGAPAHGGGYGPKQQHFGEPPAYEHEGGGGNIEISYSPPAYEINLPPTQPGDEHPAPEHASDNGGGGGGHFAEPPSHTAPAQEAPTYHAPPRPPPPPPLPPPPPSHPSPPAHKPPGSIQDYLPPRQELPLNPNHKQPAYDYPKSSYEVPIYDPIPFDASSVDHRELYPPHDSQRQPLDDSTNSNEAPEVPYDDRRAAGSTLSEATQKPTKRKRRQRKRKRVPGTATAVTATSTTKHILDTPELEAAFRAKVEPYSTGVNDNDNDADGHESSFVEEKQTTVRGPTALPYPNHEGYVSQAWNPMRLRTSAHTFFAATTARAPTTPTAAATTTAQRKRPNHRQTRPGRGNGGAAGATTSATQQPHSPASGKSVTIVTIEKSRSQDFHDSAPSTVATPASAAHVPAVQRTRPHRVRMPTRPPQVAQYTAQPAKTTPTATTKRTTKSIFETTYFKTPPHYNTELQQKLSAYVYNLPKNHRPY